MRQRNRKDSQSLNNDTFCSLPDISAQCIIGWKITLIVVKY